MIHSMSDQIQRLRKAKGVTQEEMGAALGLSYQAVSKWENDAAFPDIQMIPKIAEYFNISIDELFGYKLNALTDKERFIQFMKDNQILCLGKSELKHGGTADYYINTENFLVGLAYHGIAFSAATDIKVVAVIVIANRKNRTAENGESNLRQRYGAEVYSIITDEDIDAYLCQALSPSN